MPKGVYERPPEILLSLGRSRKGRKFTLAHRQAIADGNKGRQVIPETRMKISEALTGIKRTDEQIKWWINNVRSKQVGEKSPNYKGVIPPIAKEIRELKKYGEWRLSVYERDKFTCQKCDKVGGRLNAHHNKPFAQILQENNITNYYEAISCDELWNIDNGITLCGHGCHVIGRRG